MFDRSGIQNTLPERTRFFGASRSHPDKSDLLRMALSFEEPGTDVLSNDAALAKWCEDLLSERVIYEDSSHDAGGTSVPVPCEHFVICNDSSHTLKAALKRALSRLDAQCYRALRPRILTVKREHMGTGVWLGSAVYVPTAEESQRGILEVRRSSDENAKAYDIAQPHENIPDSKSKAGWYCGQSHCVFGFCDALPFYLQGQTDDTWFANLKGHFSAYAVVMEFRPEESQPIARIMRVSDDALNYALVDEGKTGQSICCLDAVEPRGELAGTRTAGGALHIPLKKVIAATTGSAALENAVIVLRGDTNTFRLHPTPNLDILKRARLDVIGLFLPQPNTQTDLQEIVVNLTGRNKLLPSQDYGHMQSLVFSEPSTALFSAWTRETVVHLARTDGSIEALGADMDKGVETKLGLIAQAAGSVSIPQSVPQEVNQIGLLASRPRASRHPYARVPALLLYCLIPEQTLGSVFLRPVPDSIVLDTEVASARQPHQIGYLRGVIDDQSQNTMVLDWLDEAVQLEIRAASAGAPAERKGLATFIATFKKGGANLFARTRQTLALDALGNLVLREGHDEHAYETELFHGSVMRLGPLLVRYWNPNDEAPT